MWGDALIPPEIMITGKVAVRTPAMRAFLAYATMKPVRNVAECCTVMPIFSEIAVCTRWQSVWMRLAISPAPMSSNQAICLSATTSVDWG
jgi:hypothetical protein